MSDLPLDNQLPAEEKAAIIALRYKLEPMLTLDEVAAYLQKPKGTIYNWVCEGKIPARKVGRELRFPAKEIKDWIARNAKREIA